MRYGRLNPKKFIPKNPETAKKEFDFVRLEILPYITPAAISSLMGRIGQRLDSGEILTAERIRADFMTLIGSEALSTFQKALCENYVWEFCRDNCEYWVDLFGYGYDWREFKETPFVMWDSQRAVLKVLIDHLYRRCSCGLKDVVIDKRSRDEGGTYLTIYAALHGFLFHEKRHYNFMSLSFDEVDKSNDSIFSKAERILRRQPPFLMPAGWSWSKNSPPPCRTEGYLKKPSYDPSIPKRPWQTTTPVCSIKGEATTQTVGISQRISGLFLDEFAVIGEEKVGFDREIWEKNADTADCRIALSTPRGWNTYHQRLVRSGFSDEPTVHVVVLHWSTNKNKNVNLHKWEKFPKELRYDYRAAFKVMSEYHDARKRWDSLSDEDRAYWEKEYERWEKNEEYEDKLFSDWYYREVLRRLTDNDAYESIKTELDGEPVQKGRFVFPEYVIRKRKTEAKKALYHARLEKNDKNEISLSKGSGPIQIFSEYNPDHTYVVTADPGGGIGQNFSVSHVLDASVMPVEEVAMFRSNTLGPGAQCMYYYWFCKRYGNALLIPEWNNHGNAVIEVMTMKYRYYKMFVRSDPSDIYAHLGKKYGYAVSNNKTGLVETFREHYLANPPEILIHSKETFTDMLHYADNSENPDKHDYRAEHGATDDCCSSVFLIVPGIKYLTNGSFRRIRRKSEMKVSSRRKHGESFRIPKTGVSGMKTFVFTGDIDGKETQGIIDDPQPSIVTIAAEA